MTLTPEDLTAIRQAIRDEIAAAANEGTLARIAALAEPANGPHDIERRIRDLEVKAMLADAGGATAPVIELKSRIRALEARVALLEKKPTGPAA